MILEVKRLFRFMFSTLKQHLFAVLNHW